MWAWLRDIALSASMAGPVAYRANTGERQLRWVNRSGQTVSLLGGPDPQLSRADIVLSPDGRMAALSRLVNGNLDIWLMETARDVRQRLTFGPSPRIRSRSGRRTEVASFSVRPGREPSTFTKSNSEARRRSCMRLLKARIPTTGRRTAAGFSSPLEPENGTGSLGPSYDG